MRLYFVPIYTGVDPNGYHVAGKVFAETGSFGYVPYDEASFVGRMWVVSGEGIAYAKYPPLYPALCAVAIWLFGDGADFFINPLCASLSIVAAYVLARSLGLGSWSLLAAFLLATNPVCNFYAIRQVSHPSSLFFITSGMALFFISLGRGKMPLRMCSAFISAFLVGYAAGIRYTDVLLALPPLLLFPAMMLKRDFRIPVSYLVGLAIPWGILAAYHHEAFGAPWRTGYALTGEQSGFSFAYFAENIRFYMIGIIESGLGPTALLSVLGFLLLCKRRIMDSFVFAAWIFPTLLLYTAYYWAPESNFNGFLRFLVPIFVPCILLAVFFVRDLNRHEAIKGILRVLCVAAILVIHAVWGFFESVESMENQWKENSKQEKIADFILSGVEPGSVVISSNNLLNYLDYKRSFILYTEEIFNQGQLKKLTERADIDEPAGLQKRRAQELKKMFVDLKSSEYRAKIDALLEKHLAQGRRVYFVASGASRNWIMSSYLRNYEMEEIASFKDEMPPFRLIPKTKFSTVEKQKKKDLVDIRMLKLVAKRERPLGQQDELDLLSDKISEASSRIYEDNPELRHDIEELFALRTRQNQLRQDIKRREKK